MNGKKRIEAEAKLRKHIAETDDDALPPMGELAAKFGISVGSLFVAARALRNQGVLEFRQGSRIAIAGRGEAVEARKSAAQRLAETLRKRLESGDYPVDESLPKRAYLAVREGVSVNTVAAALRRLEREGWVRRRGRRWIAGSVRTAHRSATFRDTLLVVMPRLRHWQGICKSARTEGFGRAFSSHALRQGLRLLPAYTRPQQPHSIYHKGPEGWESVRRMAGELGGRCAGFLVTALPSEEPRLGEWLERLADGRERVLWFDRNGEGGRLPLPPGVVRAAYSEDRVCQVAVNHLYRLGHRRLAFVYRPEEPWQLARANTLSKAAADLAGLQLTVYPEHSRDAYRELPRIAADLDGLQGLGLPGVDRAFAYFGSRDGQLARRFGASAPRLPRGSAHRGFIAFSRFFLETPQLAGSVEPELLAKAEILWMGLHLAPMLSRRSRSTALLAPKDLYGLSQLAWCRQVGLNVPGDLSLLSFDNVHRYGFPDLDSVDNGFDELGYKAFRYLIGDLPVRNSAGSFLIEPHLAQYGSTAPPAHT